MLNKLNSATAPDGQESEHRRAHRPASDAPGPRPHPAPPPCRRPTRVRAAWLWLRIPRSRKNSRSVFTAAPLVQSLHGTRVTLCSPLQCVLVNLAWVFSAPSGGGRGHGRGPSSRHTRCCSMFEGRSAFSTPANVDRPELVPRAGRDGTGRSRQPPSSSSGRRPSSLDEWRRVQRETPSPRQTSQAVRRVLLCCRPLSRRAGAGHLEETGIERNGARALGVKEGTSKARLAPRPNASPRCAALQPRHPPQPISLEAFAARPTTLCAQLS